MDAGSSIGSLRLIDRMLPFIKRAQRAFTDNEHRALLEIFGHGATDQCFTVRSSFIALNLVLPVISRAASSTPPGLSLVPSLSSAIHYQPCLVFDLCIILGGTKASMRYCETEPVAHCTC